MTEEQIPKRNERWRCPACKACITLHVRVTHPPLCGNKEVHSAKQVEMVRIKTSEIIKGG